MSAAIDALLAEMAAAELAVRELARANYKTRDREGRESFAAFQADAELHKAIVRKGVAEKAITEYALTWAAERARSFVTPANAQDPLLSSIDEAFAPLRGMK